MSVGAETTRQVDLTIRPTQLIVEYDVPSSMRDGVVLRCDIARPAGEGRWPVILVRTPYGKERPTMGAALNLTGLARQGFVAIIQDTRNRYSSDGEGDFAPFTGDFEDGEDSIAWAASLPYSSGDVCMYGTSYHGYTQWAAAVQQPAALRAIVPFMSPALPRRTLFFRGGVLELEGMAGWFCLIGFESLRRRYSEDPVSLQRATAALVADFQNLMRGDFSNLPLAEFEPLRHPGIGDHLFDVIAAEDGDLAVIRSLEQTQEFEKVLAPALIVGGWYDYFSHGTIDQYRGMRERAGTELARSGTQLVMGPWGHSTGLRHMIGERNFGVFGAFANLHPDGEIGEAAEFMRARLSEHKPPQRPVKIFVMGANVWREEAEWPIARTRYQSLYLASSGDAACGLDNGRLITDFEVGPPDSFDYDPADPVPTWGGNGLGLVGMSGPRDQRAVETRDDVLVYTSDVLSEDLEVTGSAILELWASTDGEDTDFIACLVDVQPDGTAFNIAEGILRGRYRDSPDDFGPGSPMVPGEPYLLRIELSPTSNLFRAGHRVRVHVTSSNFPRWARNLNIWDQRSATLDDGRVAHQVIHHDATHPSRMVLPVLPHTR